MTGRRLGRAERTLILLRHGKSDYPGGVVDHDRPLAPRGRREAALAGAAIRERAPVTRVMCSTATRARETLAATGIDAPGELHQTRSTRPRRARSSTCWSSSTQAWPDEPEVVLVVGHSPGMPATALTAGRPESDPAVLADVQARFPTSAFAVLRVHGAWADLAARRGDTDRTGHPAGLISLPHAVAWRRTHEQPAGALRDGSRGRFTML